MTKVYYDSDLNVAVIGTKEYSTGGFVRDINEMTGDVILVRDGERVLTEKFNNIVDKNNTPYASYSAFRAGIKDFFVKAPVHDAGAILYGVERIRGVADPDFYPIGNSWHHKSLPIHKKRRLCKCGMDRKVVNFLSATTIFKNEDGTDSVLDGSDGLDVMLYIPEVWAVLDGGGSTGMFERWIFSDKAFEYDGDVAIRIPAHFDFPDNATLDSFNRLRCVKNETASFAGSGSGATAGGLGYPRTNISRYNMEIYAANRGAKWYGTFYLDHLLEAAFMYIEFKTKNLKSVFGACGTGWSGADWNAYNAYFPVVKMFEAHATLSGRADIVSQGHLTGVFSKTFNFMNGATPVTYTTLFGCYRGKILRNGLWNHMSGIEYEIQSAADGGLSRVWIQTNPDLLDANRSDGSFAFKTTYTYMGNASRSEGWSRSSLRKSKQATLIGGAETTFDCQYFWTNNPASGTARRCVLEGGSLHFGSIVAFGSSYTLHAPSSTNSTFGVGFRADVDE